MIMCAQGWPEALGGVGWGRLMENEWEYLWEFFLLLGPQL